MINFGTSGIDESVIMEGRSHGGCLILWKSDLKSVMRPLIYVSKRICGIQVHANGVSY